MAEKLGNRRVTGAEQYYTPLTLARALTRLTLDAVPGWEGRSFLEPAGGTGSFVKALREQGISDITALDLQPFHDEVQKGNFLEFQTNSEFVTISNPPFGRNNALSVPFFNHAAHFSSHIAFLVPRSWRKWSVINRLDPNFELVFDHDIEVVYEDANGSKITHHNQLRSAFQLWQRSESPRPKIKVPDHGFIAKTTPEHADVAIRVFGYGCGTVYKDFPRVSNTTLLFLKVQSSEIIDLLRRLDYERFALRTAYTKALSLPEINFLLNQALLGEAANPKGLN